VYECVALCPYQTAARVPVTLNCKTRSHPETRHSLHTAPYDINTQSKWRYGSYYCYCYYPPTAIRAPSPSSSRSWRLFEKQYRL